MSDRSIIIKLDASVTGLKAGLKTAEAAVRDYGSKAQKWAQDNADDLEQVGQAGIVMGGALTAGFGLAVKTFADFDQAMSNVQAATHETAGNMELLREAAIQAGEDTAYSATEAAGAIEAMAKAGVSTADILGGGLDGALALAASGSLEVGEAAEIAATAMTQFGLSGEEIPHIADLLAAAAGKAQGSVQDMGAALKQVGLVADMTGLTIEETTAGLAAFASAGLIGSDAGTSFKSMLQRLTPQSKEAEEKMRELGISAYDASGEFIGLEKFAGNLRSSLKDLTPAQRNAAMATMFGADAVRAANVLYEQGAKGIANWTEKVSDAGYAAETAALKQDNLRGDLEKLGGSIESVFLKSGSGANDVLRSLVQSIEDVVDWVGTLDPMLLKAAGLLTGVAGAVGLAGGAFLIAVPHIADTVDALGRLNKNGGKAKGVLAGVGKAAGAAAVAFAALQVAGAVSKQFSDGIPSVEEFSNAIRKSEGGLKSLNELVAYDGLGTNIEGIGDALERVGNMNWYDDLNNWIGSMVGGTSRMQEMEEQIKNVDVALSEMDTEKAAAAFRQLAKAGKANGLNMSEVLELMPTYKEGLLQMAEAAGVTLTPQELLNLAIGKIPPKMQASATAVGTFRTAAGESIPVTEEAAQALADMGIATDGTVTSLQKLLEVMLAAGLRTLSAREASRAYQESLDAMDAKQQAIINSGRGLNSVLNKSQTGFNRTTKEGREAEAAFDGIARAGIQSAQSMAEADASQHEIQKSLEGTYKDLVAEGRQFGLTAGDARKLARDVLGVPDGIDIDTWMSDFARQKAEDTIDAVNRLDGKTAHIYTIHHDTTIISTKKGDSYASSTPAHLNGPAAFADGGAITGPGGPREDDLLIRASAGEHVLDNGDVQAMGGQAAVYRFREALHNGNLKPFTVTASGNAGVTSGGKEVNNYWTLNNVPMDNAAAVVESINFEMTKIENSGKYD